MIDVAYSLEYLDDTRWICLNRAPLADVTAPGYDNFVAVCEQLADAGEVDRLNWLLCGAVFAIWALVRDLESAEDPEAIFERYIDGGPVPLAPAPRED